MISKFHTKYKVPRRFDPGTFCQWLCYSENIIRHTVIPMDIILAVDRQTFVVGKQFCPQLTVAGNPSLLCQIGICLCGIHAMCTEQFNQAVSAEEDGKLV